MSEIELHRKLLGDTARNRALHAALAQVIRRGESTVVDLGAGTGFLSFLARKLGARHCTLVEYSDALDLAQELARRNRIDGLTFVQAHSTAVKKPPAGDVVISETLGNYALEENLLETMVDARRFLAKGGVLIPCGLTQFVAPVTSPRLQESVDVWARIGFDLEWTPARLMSLNNMYVRSIAPEDLGGGAASARVWDELRFTATGKPPASARQRSVAWDLAALAPDAEQVTVHGLALWWTAELVPGIALGTSPFDPPTHWEQVYLPLLKPVELIAGDELAVRLGSDTGLDVGVRVTWKTTQRRAGQSVSEQAQDTLTGRL